MTLSQDIEKQARKEIEEEAFREAVKHRKAILLAEKPKPWWHYLVPFTVTFKWRN